MSWPKSRGELEAGPFGYQICYSPHSFRKDLAFWPNGTYTRRDRKKVLGRWHYKIKDINFSPSKLTLSYLVAFEQQLRDHVIYLWEKSTRLDIDLCTSFGLGVGERKTICYQVDLSDPIDLKRKEIRLHFKREDWVAIEQSSPSIARACLSSCEKVSWVSGYVCSPEEEARVITYLDARHLFFDRWHFKAGLANAIRAIIEELVCCSIRKQELKPGLVTVLLDLEQVLLFRVEPPPPRECYQRPNSISLVGSTTVKNMNTLDLRERKSNDT